MPCKVSVLSPRRERRDVGSPEPALDPIDGVVDGQWLGEDPAIRGQAEEAEQAHRGQAHQSLATHARTGRPSSLAAARDIAALLGSDLTQPVDVLTGGWAALLLSLECDRPGLAVAPGA